MKLIKVDGNTIVNVILAEELIEGYEIPSPDDEVIIGAVRTPEGFRAPVVVQEEDERSVCIGKLAMTNWMVARFVETGEPVPPEVARERIGIYEKLQELHDAG
jgi:hypothetical protein